MSREQAGQPPFSVEVLADLHAGNMAPDAGADLHARLQYDTDALGVLAALDAVRGQLSDLGAEGRTTPIPFMVAERIEREVAQQGEAVRRARRLRRAIRHPDRRLASLTAAVLVVLAVAAAGVVFGIGRGGHDDATAHPSSTGVSSHDVMAALNHNSVHGRLSTPRAIAGCLHALGVDTAPLGSAEIQFRGHEAVLIVVPSVTPGKVDAMVVTPGCGPGVTTMLARAQF